jgi:hypothetical protein
MKSIPRNGGQKPVESMKARGAGIIHPILSRRMMMKSLRLPMVDIMEIFR